MLTPEGTSDGLASCWSNLEDWLFEGSAVLYHVLDVAMPYQVATRMVMTPSQLAADALDNEIARQPRLMAPLADPGPLRRLEPFSRSAWAGNQLSPQVAAERDVLISLLPEVPGTERFSWLYVDRQILQRFSISACSGRSSDLLRLWLAVMIWGYNAIDSRGPSRVRAAAGSSSLVSCLGATRTALLASAPNFSSAWVAARTPPVPEFGSSYFTKWFWALGLAAPGDCDRALIFDGRVAATIKKLGQPWVLDGRNNADRYASYVSLANSVAKWSSYCCGDPERVEYSLYWMG